MFSLTKKLDNLKNTVKGSCGGAKANSLTAKANQLNAIFL